jgi:hypothetical protein
MKLHSDLPVYKSTYDLLLGIFEFTKSFSKEYKYTVGESLKKETFSICQSEFISIAKRFICLIIDSVICENPFNPFNLWQKSYPQPVIARYVAIKGKGCQSGKLLVDNYMTLFAFYGKKSLIV